MVIMCFILTLKHRWMVPIQSFDIHFELIQCIYSSSHCPIVFYISLTIYENSSILQPNALLHGDMYEKDNKLGS